jgi:hypothetical protein
MALILMITGEGRMNAGFRRKVRCCRTNRLHAGFLVIRTMATASLGSAAAVPAIPWSCARRYRVLGAIFSSSQASLPIEWERLRRRDRQVGLTTELSEEWVEATRNVKVPAEFAHLDAELK